MREITVFTHRRPEDTAGGTGETAASAPPRAGSCCAWTRRRRPSTALSAERERARRTPISSATWSCASCSVATARSCARCSAMPVPRCPCSRSTSARSASSPRLSHRTSRKASGVPSRVSSSYCACLASGSSSVSSASQRSTTSRFTARSASGSRSSPTRLTARRPAGFAATVSWSSTPAGSTGYNLANGGPVMAWGVEGFVVSFIAPHSMSARALVVAPEDRLTIYNRSREPLDVAVDGRPVGEIEAGGDDLGELRQRRRHARPASGLVLLPPPAREVRPPRKLSSAARSRSALRRRGGGDRRLSLSVVLHRGDELVELGA